MAIVIKKCASLADNEVRKKDLINEQSKLRALQNSKSTQSR